MKKITLAPVLLLTALLITMNVSAKESQYRLSGLTCGTDGKAIEYATILLIPDTDTTDIRGVTSNADGRFSLETPAGSYTLRAAFLGFETIEKQVDINSHTDVGELTLRVSAVEMDAVVVVADVIRREADRFVVDIENSPAAIGQSAAEVLAQSPAVWVDERSGISINGRGGTKVYINEREVRETGEDLVNYLKTIQAEDIKRIDIIPIGGVEYDADTQGGIIRITQKQQRENGLEGSVGLNYRTSLSENYAHILNPSFNLNYMVDKFRLYTSLSEWYNRNRAEMNVYYLYKNGNSFDESTIMDNSFNSPNIKLGGIYDISDKHSVGLEFNTRGFLKGFQEMNASSEENLGEQKTYYTSKSKLSWRNPQLNISGNYIMKLDTAGSIFKIILDYYYRENHDWGNYREQSTGYRLVDSTYTNRQQTISNWYIATTDFDLKASSNTTVKTGLKFSHRDADSWQRYHYEKDGFDHPINDLNFNVGFREDITAIYGNYARQFGRNISLSLGFRGEYTHMSPVSHRFGSIKKQHYFSFFPSGNLSVPFHKDGKHNLILSYSRKINRPWYYNLIPHRTKISSLLTNVGNPDLKPAYTNDYSLSFVFARKYNISLIMQQVKDEIGQIIMADPEDPDKLLVTMGNLKKTMYGINVNIPAQVRPWWKLTANLMGSYVVTGLTGNTDELLSFHGNIGNTFTMAKKFHFTLDGFYMAPMLDGTLKILSHYRVNAGLRYSFAQDRITAGVTVNDIFNSGKFRIQMRIPEYERSNFTNKWMLRHISFSIRYNFRKGKEFKVRNVETGAGEEENKDTK